MEPREIFPKGKQQRKVKARSLFCFWPACAGTADRAVSELGMSLRELARQLEMSPPGVGFSVEKGESIAGENGLQLIEYDFVTFLPASPFLYRPHSCICFLCFKCKNVQAVQL